MCTKNIELSVSIISFNEETNIGRTLDAVKDLAAEIIVVDSHSTDKTVDIAKSYGAKVYVEDWKGHIAQKNSALEKCSKDWVLCLDCDEVITDDLKQEIVNVLKNPKVDGYSINRRTFYMGKLLNYSWQPDYKLRLVKKSANPSWGGYDPHDKLMIGSVTSKLKNYMIHYSFNNFSDHMAKTVNHARNAANSYYKSGKTVTGLTLLLRPYLAVFNKLILKRGILDGVPGVLASLSSGVYVYMKYSFLWELIKNNGVYRK